MTQPTQRQRYFFQLYAQGPGVVAGKMIVDSGGVVYVAQAGDARKQAITDKDGVALTNPRALTQGGCEFFALSTAASVDLYIMCPGGQFVVVRGVAPGQTDISVDVSALNQVAMIPFAMEDTTVAETDTGFDMPANSMALPHPAVRVTAIDATETWDFGVLSSETAGDADGFIVQISVGTLGLAQGLILTGAVTIGALMKRQDSANAGDLVPAAHVFTGANGRSLTYTPSAGSDTARGIWILPYVLSPL